MLHLLRHPFVCWFSSIQVIDIPYYSSTLVIRNIWGDGWSGFLAYPDHQGKLCHVGDIQKKPSPYAKVKLLKLEILHLTVHRVFQEE
jgi:hypothetical protein